MVKFYLDKNPAGKLNSIMFGVCCVLAGLVRIFTFGFIFSTFILDHTRKTSKNHITKLKEKNASV
jgi:hypothetical protein